MSGRLRDRVEAEAQRLLRERVARLRQALEEGLDALAQPLRLPLAPGEWGAVEGPAQLQAMRDATEAIARGTSQREVLTALVDAAAAFYPRAALFIVKGASLAGWAGLGFLGDGGFSSADLPGIALPAAGSHLLARALGQRSLVLQNHPQSQEQLTEQMVLSALTGQAHPLLIPGGGFGIGPTPRRHPSPPLIRFFEKGGTQPTNLIRLQGQDFRLTSGNGGTK